MKCEECFTDDRVSYSDHYSKQLCMDCYNEMSEAEFEQNNEYFNEEEL